MPLHDPQLVIELAGNDFGLPRVVVEMFLLAGDFEMSAAGEVAVDLFFRDDLLDAVDRGQRRGIHALREFASIHGDELVDAQLHAGKNHASIAGTGAPANGLGFEHRNFRAALGQRAAADRPVNPAPITATSTTSGSGRDASTWGNSVVVSQ